jgi:primosomal protein N' (replication factor Y)
MISRASVGARVRINLNGRRVAGWIVDIASHGERDSHLSLERLSPLFSVSGAGVEPHLMGLTQWVAREWFGSWRATLSSASAPRMREKPVHARRGTSPTIPDDAVASAAIEITQQGGGLLVVPPVLSALNVVAALAGKGSVLVVCPTVRMAIMGAASLRRRGFTTALVPDDWEFARAGVDVVIGARSAVFAPCADISAIVVIDEHDESLHEERSPAWDAVAVVRERAQRENVPLVLTSPIPSMQSLIDDASRTLHVSAEVQWPTISVIDLEEVPVANSLLSSELLQAVAEKGTTTVCVLNTKGKARLIVCKSCRAVQSCKQCAALLTQNDQGVLLCERCNNEHGSVCVSCGRSSFVVPRGGVSQLRTQLEASSPNPIIEVTSDSDDSWTKGNVFIGTEAVLYRIPTADTAVFADIDRDLGAPRLTASSEVLALIARAARIVGVHGRIIIQTRQLGHPLMKALASHDVASALRALADSDLAQRQLFSMPPYSRIVRITLTGEASIESATFDDAVDVAKDGDSYLLRSLSRDAITQAISHVREVFGTSVRVHADPRRY